MTTTPSAPLHALVVEDDDDLRWLVSTWLTRMGWTVTECATGSEGLHAVEHDDHHPIDLVLLDVLLPDMDGRTLYQRIREHGTVPVLVTSVMIEGVTSLAPYDGLLAKPFRRRAFEAAVSRVVDMAGQERMRPGASA